MTARTRRSLSVVLAAAFAGGAALAGVGVSAQAPSPPPPPIPSSSPVTLPGTPQPVPTVAGPPSPLPSVTPLPAVTLPPSNAPKGRRGAPRAGSASPAPTATPTSPAFATLDGTWELQVQYLDHTAYSYLVLRQKESTLSGFWRQGKTETPLEGTYDGRLIRLTVKAATGDISFAGYVENGSDMVGEVDFGKAGQVAFTAEHRGEKNPHGLLQKF